MVGACVAGGMCGRQGHAWQGGTCMVGACMAEEGMHGRGHAWLRRACMAGGVHGGGHAWQGVCMPGGMCGRGVMHGGGGHVWQILRDTVNERAVRILLECILILTCLWTSKRVLTKSPHKHLQNMMASRSIYHSK